MARRTVRWLTPKTAAAALAESQPASPVAGPLSAVHALAEVSIAGVASPTSDRRTSARNRSLGRAAVVSKTARCETRRGQTVRLRAGDGLRQTALKTHD